MLGSALLVSAVVLAVTSVVRPASAGTQIFRAVADAHVSEAEPTRNFGSAAALKIDAKPVRRAYVQFSVQNVSGGVTRATLRLYTRSSSSAGIEIRGAASGWSESTIKYSNAPAPS